VQLPSLVLTRHADVIANESLENQAERWSKYMSSTVWSADPYDLHRLASNCEPVSLSNDEANSSRLQPRARWVRKYPAGLVV
jgi:hypothetical protein